MTDLRSELQGLDEQVRDRFVAAIASDWREAELSDVDQALCAYADKLTLRPSEVSEADLDGMRAAGLTDHAIHDAIQTISYFNYINRVADAVHVDLEAGMPPYPE